MNRINKLFADKPQDLLSIYFCAGAPTLDGTANVIRTLASNGINMIEIGIPFSDPMADGPVIQDAATKALHNGMSIRLLFEQLKDIRKDVEIPLILMGYLNPIVCYGFENFCQKCVEVGIDGMILPDLPFRDYMEEYKPIADKYDLRIIMLITPETSDERIRFIDENTDGFIYMVFYLFVRLRENKPIITKLRIVRHVPAHQRALSAIEKIKAERMQQSEDQKAYYTQLTDTLRKYIQERFGFNAMEMTSSEIIGRLQENGDKKMLDELRELFTTADLVKFAKYSTLINENDLNLVNAVNFIDETKQDEQETVEKIAPKLSENDQKVKKNREYLVKGVGSSLLSIDYCFHLVNFGVLCELNHVGGWCNHVAVCIHRVKLDKLVGRNVHASCGETLCCNLIGLVDDGVEECSV